MWRSIGFLNQNSAKNDTWLLQQRSRVKIPVNQVVCIEVYTRPFGWRFHGNLGLRFQWQLGKQNGGRPFPRLKDMIPIHSELTDNIKKHGIAIWTCKHEHVQWNFKESLLETQWSHLQPAHQATIRTSKLWGQMSRMGWGTLGGGTKESCPIYAILKKYIKGWIFQRIYSKKKKHACGPHNSQHMHAQPRTAVPL